MVSTLNASPRIEETLSCIPQFADISPSVLAEIAQRASPRHIEAGQVIYLEGEPADLLYILEKGWVKATRISPEGREQAMQFLKPRNIFGDIALWANSPYPCTVVALEPVDVWVIASRDVHELLQRFPEFGTAIIRHLAGRVMHYITMVEDLSLRSVEARLAKNLLQNAERSGDEMLVPRRGWTTFDEIAVRLGTVRDVLSRALNNLEKEGFLRIERHAIVILDEEGLRARGES